MADWLKVIASVNPLTYAIEPIRYLYFHSDWSLTKDIVIATPWLNFNFLSVLTVLVIFDLAVLVLIQPLLRRRFA